MDLQARTFWRAVVASSVGAATALMLLGTFQASFAEEWKSPQRLVGLSGQIGAYEEVQRKLEQLGWQDVRHTNEKPTHSLKDLHNGQLSWRNALTNIEVSFAYSLQRFRNTARVIAQKKQNQAVPDDFAFEAQVAMKDEKRFTHIRNTTPIKPSGVMSGNSSSKSNARRSPEFVYAYNGVTMKTFEPTRSIGHIHRAKLDSVESRHMWYFDAIAVPTGPGASRQRESAWYVPVALSLPSVYRVLPTLQEVDGFRCHVVTSGPDTLWIDAEHGFSVRRRVWFQMTSLNQPPVLAFIYVNRDFRQYADDIWLPHECYRLDFGGTLEPANTRGLLAEVHTVMAKAIEVNTVSDDRFDLKFPPGTNVQDLVENKSYFVPHGEHLLDEAIARANPIVNGEVKPYLSGGGIPSVWRQLLILNAVTASLIGGQLLWRRRRRRVKGG